MPGITRVVGTLTCLTPCHSGGDEKSGSTPVLRTIGMWDPVAGEEYRIPHLSGNSIRGYLRRLIMRDLLDLVGYDIQAPKAHHILFTGGVLESSADNTGKVELAFRKEVRDTIPPLELLGSSVSNQMLAGCSVVEMALPICKELAWQWPDLDHPHKLVSVRQFTDHTFSTRRDDLRAEREEDEQAMQMKIEFQVFKPGTVFVHGFVLRHASELATACLGRAIELWAEDPVAGAKSGSGHGRLLLNYKGIPNPAPYLAYLERDGAKVRECLDILGVKVQPPKKSAKPEDDGGLLEDEEADGE